MQELFEESAGLYALMSLHTNFSLPPKKKDLQWRSYMGRATMS